MELRANGVLQLPDLHLDIHVYSEKPVDRFVFINMNKYREPARSTARAGQAAFCSNIAVTTLFCRENKP